MENLPDHIKIEAICAGCGKPIYSNTTYWLLPDGIAVHGKKCYQLSEERNIIDNKEGT